MTNNVSVAVIGAAGIGRIHIREFLNAGADVVGILCSSPESTRHQADVLSNEFGISLRSFNNLEDVTKANVQAVSICTPPDTHLHILEKMLHANTYVFCEKPMFWQHHLSGRSTQRVLSNIESISDGRLLVNTSNAWFIEAYRNLSKQNCRPSKFDFSFHTHGPHRGANIGVDLLPHALSLLLELDSEGDLEDLDVTIEDNFFKCDFNFGKMRCHFDLRQNASIDKKLSFTLDGRKVDRMQASDAGEYAVYLVADDLADGQVRVADPFKIYITRFIETVTAGGNFKKQAPVMFRNLRLMTQIIRNESLIKQ